MERAARNEKPNWSIGSIVTIRGRRRRRRLQFGRRRKGARRGGGKLAHQEVARSLARTHEGTKQRRNEQRRNEQRATSDEDMKPQRHEEARGRGRSHARTLPLYQRRPGKLSRGPPTLSGPRQLVEWPSSAMGAQRVGRTVALDWRPLIERPAPLLAVAPRRRPRHATLSVRNHVSHWHSHRIN